MLKNIKFKTFSQLNDILKIKDEDKICVKNKEFMLPIYFNDFFIEKIFVIEQDGGLRLLYSLTYDYIKGGDNHDTVNYKQNR